MVKKIVDKVTDEVVEAKEDLTREANEVVGTISFKRWQVILASATIVLLSLAVIL